VRLLCLSDIHGHAEALAAVLATAERSGYDRVLVAGDLCFPGPEPLRTWQRLNQLGAVCVQGVGDRALATVPPDSLRPSDDFERARLRRLIETREELGEGVLEQLAALPVVYREPLPDGGQLVLVHGAPTDPLEPMTHDLSDETLAAMVGADPASLVLCGGSHVPFDRTLTEYSGFGTPGPAVRIINLGSVGEAPGADVSGGRFAHASFVRCSVDGIEVEQFVVPLGRAA
jgi:predicted phosphodiesterase